MARFLRTAVVFGLFVSAGALTGAASAWWGPSGVLVASAAGFCFALVLTGLAPASWDDTLYPPRDNVWKE